MFEKIINLIKGGVGKILNKQIITQKLGVELATTDTMQNYIGLWSELYADKPPWLSEEIKSLNIPSTVASEIARMVTLEMSSEIKGSTRAAYLDEQYQKVIERIRNIVEYGVAKGGLMLKPYVKGDEIVIDIIQANCFYPVKFDSNGSITGCIFTSQKVKGKYTYTRVEHHDLQVDGYYIVNRAFKSMSSSSLNIGTEISLKEIEEWAEIEPEIVITGIDRPMYSYFKTAYANNKEPDSPLGVSCFARAVGTIMEADKLYSNLLWEFESGQRAIYVDEQAFKPTGKVDEAGRIIRNIPNKRLYKPLDISSDEGFFEDWTPDFRNAAIEAGLDVLLKKIEDKTGVSRGTISLTPDTQVKTATELKIAQHRKFETVKSNQTQLQNALSGLIDVMNIWCDLYSLAPSGNYEAVFDFDDSVLTDNDKKYLEMLQLYQIGIIKDWELRAWYKKEDEKTAKANVGGVSEVL